jgi:hypothetical protein
MLPDAIINANGSSYSDDTASTVECIPVLEARCCTRRESRDKAKNSSSPQFHDLDTRYYTFIHDLFIFRLGQSESVKCQRSGEISLDDLLGHDHTVKS